MKKRMTIMIIALVVVFGGILAWNILRSVMMKAYFSKFQLPPISLSATRAIVTKWNPELPAVGSLQAINGVNVTSQNSGQIVKIYFNSGDVVKAGQPLVQQDISIDTQILKGYQASLNFNKVTYRRQLDLSKKGFVSQAELDSSLSQLQQAQANVAKTEITINQKSIKAPFTGKVGIRLANLGQYLNPGDPIAPLQQLDPLRVLFTLPEQDFSKLYVGQPILLSVDAYPNKTFSGKINAINSEVNVNTRNIQVEAFIANPNSLLYPGMFANVRVILPAIPHVVVVPQTAVSYDLYGDSVYVLTPIPTDKAESKKINKDQPAQPTVYTPKQIFVKTGERQGNQVVITQGLSGGELVVTSGQLKITDNSTVVVDNSVNVTSAQTVNTLY